MAFGQKNRGKIRSELTPILAAAAVVLFYLYGRYLWMWHEVVIRNEGEQAIILLDVPAADFRDKGKRPGVELLRPSSSGGRRYLFSNKLRKWPDSATIVWQFAEAINCEDIEKQKGCVYRPIPGEIYRQRLNLAAMRGSKAGKLAGRSRGIWNGRHTLETVIQINGSQIKVGTRNSQIGGFKWM